MEKAQTALHQHISKKPVTIYTFLTLSPMTLCSMSLALIALASGMLLLAKAFKDALNMLYKIIAYLIIACSLANLAAGAMLFAAHFACSMSACHKMEPHEKWAQKEMHFCSELHEHENMDHGGKNCYCDDSMHHFDCKKTSNQMNCKDSAMIKKKMEK